MIKIGYLSTMPLKFRLFIKSWDTIEVSPYFHSYYNMKGKSWDYTPDIPYWVDTLTP